MFAAAFVSFAGGLFLLGLRGVVPDMVTVVAANGAVGIGFLGLWRGTRALSGAPAQPQIEAGLLVVLMAAFVHFTYQQPDVRWRIVVLSLFIVATSTLSVRDSIRFARASVGRSGGVLVAVFAGIAAYSFLRATATAFQDEIPDFLSAGNFQAAAFLVLIFGCAALAFAMVWATLAQMAEDLSLANRELSRSNAQLECFARVVSHDLRDPLSTARGYVDLLLVRHGDALPEKPRDYVQAVGAAMDRCMSLVEDILLLSRLQSDTQPQVRVSMADACAEAISNLNAAIERDGATVHLDRLPDILGARGEMVRLFQNLIGNSIRYRHPDRTPEIRVEALRDGDSWRFAVIDNGKGIDLRRNRRFLPPFERDETPHPDSTGLGLSICRQIVQNNGGRLWMDSAPGAGTVVHFALSADLGSPIAAEREGTANLSVPCTMQTGVVHSEATAQLL